MEVRAGSVSGRLLYSGTLERGQRKSFQGRRLQLALREPDNVVVRVNGNRVELPAGTAFVVTARRIVTASLLTDSRPRAAVVVTGTELVRGERTDRNGPFLASEALRLGLEPERITIVGDRPEDLERALADGFTADLCLVSGGLGPTHDDRTVEMVARVAGRALVVDEASSERSRRSRARSRNAWGGRTTSSRPA